MKSVFKFKERLFGTLFSLTLFFANQAYATESIPTEIGLDSPKDERCMVLTLDGGGARGLLSVTVLEKLEQDLNDGLKRTSDNYLPLGAFFDVIVGTSTGSIIGGKLAAKAKAKDIVQLYEENLSKIFYYPWYRKILTLDGIIGPRYPLETLSGILKNKLPQGSRLSDVKKPHLLLTTYDLQKQRNFTFDSKKATDPSEDYPLYQAVLASCAQPAAFKPAVVTNGNGESKAFTDPGTMINPIQLGVSSGISYLKSLGFKDDKVFNTTNKNIKIVSMGTGYYDQSLDIKSMEKWGVAQWALPEFNLLTREQKLNATEEVKRLGFVDCHRLDILLDEKIGSTDDDVSASTLEIFRKKGLEICASDSYKAVLELVSKVGPRE